MVEFLVQIPNAFGMESIMQCHVTGGTVFIDVLFYVIQANYSTSYPTISILGDGTTENFT